MHPSKLLRASNDGKVEWNTTRCILPVAYRRICNGNPGLWMAVFLKAWDKCSLLCINTCFLIEQTTTTLHKPSKDQSLPSFYLCVRHHVLLVVLL